MITGLSNVLCQVESVVRASKFYGEVLGLTPGVMSPYWADFTLPDGSRIGLHPPFAKPQESKGGGWILGVEVDDIIELRQTLESAGHQVGNYHDVPGGVLVEFSDPDGNPIQAIQLGLTSKEIQ